MRFAPVQVTVIEESRRKMAAQVTSAGGQGEILVVFSRPWFPGYRAVCNGQPVPVEVGETDEGFTVRAKVPGFQEKEIELHVEPRIVYISGQREEKAERKKGKLAFFNAKGLARKMYKNSSTNHMKEKKLNSD